MSDVITVLKYEARQSLLRMNVIAVLLILAVALGFIQYGVLEYKKSLEQKASFQSVETDLVDTYATYRHYASYGFRVMFLPAPMSIFFTNSTVLKDMTANIFPGHRLHIYQSLKGRTTFGVNKYLFADYSGIFLFFGGLIALLYGYMAFSPTEYLRFLASITGKKKLFISIFLARAIMLALFTLLFLALAVLLITINGVAVGIDRHLLLFFIEMYGVSLLFLALGSVFGSCKSLFVGLAGSIASWFLFLFIVPFLIGIIIAAKSDFIKPENQLEIEKLKLLMDFEKRSNEEAGILDINQKPADIDRELVQSYYKNEFQKIQALEDELKAQMKTHTKLYYRLSSFFPTTGYLAFTNEISSKGYEALYAFYQSVKQTKEAFFKEYMKQVYFSSQPPKVEPFLKGDDNVFTGKPALPEYLLQGIIITMLWIAGFAMLAYYRFKKSLFALPEKKKNMRAPKDIVLKSGQIIEWDVKGDLLNRILYCAMSNETGDFKKKDYDIKATLDDQVLNTAKQRQNFLYLCHPTQIPGDIKVKNYLTLVMDFMKLDETKREEIKARFSLESIQNKKFRCLELDELGNIFLAILEMKPFAVYLIDNIGDGMYWEFCLALKTKLDALWSSEGAAVLLIASEFHYLDKETIKRGYYENNAWLNGVEGARDAHERENA